MHRPAHKLRALTLLLPLAACQPEATAPKVAPTKTAHTALVEAELRHAGAAFATPTPRPYHVESYDLKGRFDWSTLTLHGTVAITLDLDAGAPPQVLLDSQVNVIDEVLANQTPVAFTADRSVGTLTIDVSSLPSASLAQPIVLTVSYETIANGDGTGIADPNFQADALRAINGRAGDPVASRTLNTYGEPDSARQWMPCHDDPADRAKFAVELTMANDETLIANGALITDQIDAVTHERTMGYATKYTLPTYLMAFAQGQFVNATAQHGALPISVWARRGVPVDFQGLLTQTDRQISLYESKLIPFPFEKYAVVLLPEFPGGEEHASITFIGETDASDGSLAGDRSMIGHELSHQWFGDYMTVETWDDLWVKEGMATVIESEQGRPYMDTNGSGRLFVSQMQVQAGDAIVDSALDPELKYTTGPYGRAGWLISQIRSLVGEDQFWATLRGVLQTHAFGNITGPEFLAAFRPALGDAAWEKAVASLPAKQMPQLTVAQATAGITVSLSDPDGSLIAPVTVRSYTDAATYASQPLAAGGSVTVPAADARLWVLDPEDRHPLAQLAADPVAFTTVLAPALAPHGAAATAAFAAQSASVQAVALSATTPWTADAASFLAVYGALGSEEAQVQALHMGCAAAVVATLPAADRTAWEGAITELLLVPPYLGLSSWYVKPAIDGCLDAAGANPFTTEMARLSADPANAGVSNGELILLTSLGQKPADYLATFGPVALGGASVRDRQRATSVLANATASAVATDSSTAAVWQQSFRTLLETSNVQEVQANVLKGVVASLDQAALPDLQKLIVGHSADEPVRISAVCAAYSVTKAVPATWDAFVKGIDDQSTLPNVITARLTNPALCGG